MDIIITIKNNILLLFLQLFKFDIYQSISYDRHLFIRFNILNFFKIINC
jgi:hypothetical protein